MEFEMIRGIGATASALLGVLLLAWAPPASPDAQLYQPAALRADLEEMYRRLKGAHIDLYAFKPRAEMDRAYAETLSRLDRPMTRMQAQVMLQTFLARAKMGHTRIDFPHQAWAAFRAGGGKSFPLAIRPVGGRVWVTDNMSGSDAVKRGDELLALEGEPIGGWLARTGRHVSAETTYMRDSLLEFEFARLLWLEIGQKERFHRHPAPGRTAVRCRAVRPHTRGGDRLCRRPVADPGPRHPAAPGADAGGGHRLSSPGALLQRRGRDRS